MSSLDHGMLLANGVDNILIPPELSQRAGRAPGYESESRALAALASEMASNPGDVLSKVAKIALDICHAESVGVSSIEPGGVVRWHAAAGALAHVLQGTMQPDTSPSSTFLTCDFMQLHNGGEELFPSLLGREQRICENLVVPWLLEQGRDFVASLTCPG